MNATPSLENEGKIIFTQDAALIELPIGEFSQEQLLTLKTSQEADLARTNEMLSHFSA